jgi:hypothetical protein
MTHLQSMTKLPCRSWMWIHQPRSLWAITIQHSSSNFIHCHWLFQLSRLCKRKFVEPIWTNPWPCRTWLFEQTWKISSSSSLIVCGVVCVTLSNKIFVILFLPLLIVAVKWKNLVFLSPSLHQVCRDFCLQINGFHIFTHCPLFRAKFMPFKDLLMTQRTTLPFLFQLLESALNL